jgi:hypothetical protein
MSPDLALDVLWVVSPARQGLFDGQVAEGGLLVYLRRWMAVELQK